MIAWRFSGLIRVSDWPDLCPFREVISEHRRTTGLPRAHCLSRLCHQPGAVSLAFAELGRTHNTCGSKVPGKRDRRLDVSAFRARSKERVRPRLRCQLLSRMPIRCGHFPAIRSTRVSACATFSVQGLTLGGQPFHRRLVM